MNSYSSALPMSRRFDLSTSILIFGGLLMIALCGVIDTHHEAQILEEVKVAVGDHAIGPVDSDIFAANCDRTRADKIGKLNQNCRKVSRNFRH